MKTELYTDQGYRVYKVMKMKYILIGIMMLLLIGGVLAGDVIKKPSEIVDSVDLDTKKSVVERYNAAEWTSTKYWKDNNCWYYD
jgi:hypothetical protein